MIVFVRFSLLALLCVFLGCFGVAGCEFSVELADLLIIIERTHAKIIIRLLPLRLALLHTQTPPSAAPVHPLRLFRLPQTPTRQPTDRHHMHPLLRLISTSCRPIDRAVPQEHRTAAGAEGAERVGPVAQGGTFLTGY